MHPFRVPKKAPKLIFVRDFSVLAGKAAPRRPKTLPKPPQKAPRGPQDGARTLKDALKTRQRPPGRAENVPRRRWKPVRTAKKAQAATKRPQDAPSNSRNGSERQKHVTGGPIENRFGCFYALRMCTNSSQDLDGFSNAGPRAHGPIGPMGPRGKKEVEKRGEKYEKKRYIVRDFLGIIFSVE